GKVQFNKARLLGGLVAGGTLGAVGLYGLAGIDGHFLGLGAHVLVHVLVVILAAADRQRRAESENRHPLAHEELLTKFNPVEPHAAAACRYHTQSEWKHSTRLGGQEREHQRKLGE